MDPNTITNTLQHIAAHRVPAPDVAAAAAPLKPARRRPHRAKKPCDV